MNQPQELDEQLRAHLAREATTRAPGWVIEDLVRSVDSTPQVRHRRMPWRNMNMPSSLKIAVGASIVALVFAGGLVLHPLGSDTGGGGLAPEPSLSPEPSSQPLPSPIDTSDWLTFTSARHGFSLQYPPDGWSARLATAPWVYGDPVDHDLYNDPATDQLDGDAGMVFWLASQAIPAAAASADPGESTNVLCWPPMAQWPVIQLRDVEARYHGGTNCGFWETQVVAGGRLYALTASDTVPLDLYQAVMSTVVLDPASADDTPPGAQSPMPSTNLAP